MTPSSAAAPPSSPGPTGQLGPYLESLQGAARVRRRRRAARPRSGAAQRRPGGRVLPRTPRASDWPRWPKPSRRGPAPRARSSRSSTSMSTEVLWPAAELSVHAQLDYLVGQHPGARRAARPHPHPGQREAARMAEASLVEHRASPRLTVMTVRLRRLRQRADGVRRTGALPRLLDPDRRRCALLPRLRHAADHRADRRVGRAARRHRALR